MTGRWAYDPPDLLWQRACSTTDHVAETIRAALAAADNDSLMLSYLLAGRAGVFGVTTILDAADRGLRACGWGLMRRTPPGTWTRSRVGPASGLARDRYLVGNVSDTGMRMSLDVCSGDPRLELQVLEEKGGWIVGSGNHEIEIDLHPLLWEQMLRSI